jgi:hypothetical protein
MLGVVSRLNVTSTGKFECTGGKDPSSMTKKDYLAAFVQGPCSPFMIMAGIAETKLMIQIDCPKLQKDHPAIFAGCGWNTCENGWFSSSPKKEYAIWIPDVISPFTLLDPLSSKHQNCFSSVFGLMFDKSSGIPRANPPSGVVIVPLGMTEATKRNSKCGFDAISNILPISFRLNPLKWRAYDLLRLKLESMGYLIGLTLQALPYDWRMSISDNQVSQKFLGIVNRLNAITGKKVNIVAHSFGNVNTLHNLWKMSQEQKDRMINKYFAIAPPWLGSPTTAAMMLGGSSNYHFKGMGLNFDSFKKTLATFPGVFDLMPRNVWPNFKDTLWMRSVKNRVFQERGECDFQPIDPEDDIVNKIFPPTTDTCYDNDWATRKGDCTSGLTEYFALGKVNGTMMTTGNLDEIFTKYSYNDNAGDLFNASHPESYDRLVNPGVPVVVIYTNFLTTGNDFVYNDNPKPKTQVDGSNFVEPDKVDMDFGDTSVLTTSSLLPGIKWAFEFDKKSVPGAKPVVFLEMCSSNNRKAAVFQTDSNEIVKNERQGVDCICHTASSASGCDHLGMISDTYLIDYLANSAQDKASSNPQRMFDNASEESIRDFIQNCELLNA